MEQTEIIAYINSLLDTVRKKNRYANDKALASALGVNSKTLSFWRNGKSIPKSTLVLVGIIAQEQAEKEPGGTPGGDKLVMTDEMELSSL